VRQQARSGLQWGLILSGALASGIEAQPNTARVRGTVQDSVGSPVALAQLTVQRVVSISDSAGRFLLEGLPGGASTLLVRRMGFEPRSVSLTLVEGRTDSILLVLAALPRELEGLTATDARAKLRLSDFYRHRQNGMGYYFDRKQIEERRVQRLSDLLRRMSGVRVFPDRNGRLLVRMSRSTGTRDCPPDFWIDGVRAPFLNADDVPLTDVEALEVYRGNSALPPEFLSRTGNPQCGAIVIWTRVPG
jgi:hypothetical protein